MPHRKRCKRCQREMDCIQGDPKRYWCLSCNIEYHSDRPEGERWVDASGEGFGVRNPVQDEPDEEPTPTPTEAEDTQDNDSDDPEPDSGDQGTLF